MKMTHHEAKRLVAAHLRAEGSTNVVGNAKWDKFYGVWVVNDLDPTAGPDELICGGGPLVVTPDGAVHGTDSAPGSFHDLMSRLSIEPPTLPDDVWAREGEGLALLADVDMKEALELAAYAEEQHRKRLQERKPPGSEV